MPSDLIYREDAKDYARHAMAKGLNVLEYLDEVPAADFRPVAYTKIENALDMVRAERNRQNSLWGDQSNNHPFEWMSILGEEYGELCEAVNETCFQNGTHPERGGRDKIIKEAAHIAAVAVAIIEANCGATMGNLSKAEHDKEQREYEAAIEAAYCEMYEPTYDPETGAM